MLLLITEYILKEVMPHTQALVKQDKLQAFPQMLLIFLKEKQLQQISRSLISALDVKKMLEELKKTEEQIRYLSVMSSTVTHTHTHTHTHTYWI